MPELPDVELYVTRLRERLVGARLLKASFYSPFVLRSFAVKPSEVEGLAVTGVSRLGKRIVLELEDEHFIVIHLMIAGRLQWQSPLPEQKKALGKMLLASFRFEEGQLGLFEISSKKRASIHLVRGREGLTEHRRAGIDVFGASSDQIKERLLAQNRTLKRALTDPNAFDGIGNAYSDEILFWARLSPVRRTGSLTDEEIERLHGAAKDTLRDWKAKLEEKYPGFPKPTEITAFRPEFATHGKYNQPCPVCGQPIQRIVYAENETNYCAKCQNEGRLLADRSLSRLLKDDWPKTLEEMIGA
ncbi:MAG: Fpg/Nei family DNA glycosylase [Fimbriimonas sp.]